ncbi:hypothetical protein Tco_0959835 [Tanacetum coccineum]
MALIRLSSPAIRCIGPGPIRVYYEPSPRAVSVTRLEFRDQISFCSCLVPRLLRRFGSLSLVTWVLRVPLSSAITSLKCVLTQEHLDAICAKYFVPEEVHPQLPSSDATMHERPAGKVGMYTRFFDYANYRCKPAEGIEVQEQGSCNDIASIHDLTCIISMKYVKLELALELETRIFTLGLADSK